MVLLLACVVLQWQGGEYSLRFDRQAIEQGHLWLLLSAHLVHLGWHHLWLNMGGLLLVSLFFGRYASPLTWLLLLLFCGLAVGAGLFLFSPQLHYYVGLSGVLHGLFIMGGWLERRVYPLAGNSLLLLIVVKLVWEQLVGPMPGSVSLTGGPVAVDAHLYGAVAGVLFVLLHQVIHVHDRHQDGQHDEQNHKAHNHDQ
jgi:rhomboid family GlyGly-CTERM serine protease